MRTGRPRNMAESDTRSSAGIQHGQQPLPPRRDRSRLAAALAGAGSPPNTRSRRRREPRQRRRHLLCPLDVPLSLGEPAHGPCAQLRDHRCDRPGAAAARPPGAAPDGLGRLRSSGGECRDRAGRGSRRLDRCQHRPDAGPAAAPRPLDRLGPGSGHLPRRLLPLDPVAVPPVPRGGPGLPQRGHGQLGSDRSDRAGQ